MLSIVNDVKSKTPESNAISLVNVETVLGEFLLNLLKLYIKNNDIVSFSVVLKTTNKSGATDQLPKKIMTYRNIKK